MKLPRGDRYSWNKKRTWLVSVSGTNMPTYHDDPDYDLLPSDYEEMERIRLAAVKLAETANNPMWRDHNCWKCREGTKVCPQGGSHRCDYPIAKNH